MSNNPSPENISGKIRLVFITGMSGAGVSTTLSVFRDIGYEVFDNFPLFMVTDLLDHLPDAKAIAISLDSRTRGFDAKNIAELRQEIEARGGYDISAIFIDCDDRILERRYVQTKRRHPAALKDHSIYEGIVRERNIMTPMKKIVDRVIDTSEFSVYDLRRILENQYHLAKEDLKMRISVMSFGYKYGMPNHADRVDDVRFLRNPYWDSDLREFTGKDSPVKSYIKSDPSFDDYIAKTQDLIKFLLPLYKEEGKSYITLAFGCTGGKHRSVFTAETIANDLRNQGYDVMTEHRDINH